VTFNKERQTYPHVFKDEIQPNYAPDSIVGVTVMMSMDKKVVSRSVYSMGDWLNEVGGYSSCLFLAG